ncbi:MAG: NAD-dependent epimerase/dehydratase family protein [Planctomycetota bacterium]|nr:NAD-dependent epimerase/dehydratase family protein [Planctomycetota bacterium]
MAKVFVTGGTGFIGSELVRQLQARGDQVACLVRNPTTARELPHLQLPGVELYPGDVCNLESLETAISDHSQVYHVGGATRVHRTEEFFACNEQGVRNVLAVAAKCTNPPVVVQVSSLAAAGVSPSHQPRTEADDCEPVSNYGRSKLAGEQAAREFADRVPVTIVRPPMVLGPGDKVSLAMFRSLKRFGVHIVPSLSNYEYSVVDVHDLVECMLLAAERGERLPANASTCSKSDGTGIYFTTTSEEITFAELGKLIAAGLELRWYRIRRIPEAVSWAVAAINEATRPIRRDPPFVNVDKLREATAGHWTCRSNKAKQQLGLSNSRTLAERVKEACQWYRQAGWV